MELDPYVIEGVPKGHKYKFHELDSSADVEGTQHHIDSNNNSQNDNQHNPDLANDVLRGIGSSAPARFEIPFRSPETEFVRFDALVM